MVHLGHSAHVGSSNRLNIGDLHKPFGLRGRSSNATAEVAVQRRCTSRDLWRPSRTSAGQWTSCATP